jgi:hypothetical protein
MELKDYEGNLNYKFQIDHEEDDEELSDNNEDEFIDNEIEETMQNDYQLGLFIKNKFIPYAIDYYLGNLNDYEINERERVFNEDLES